VQVLLSGSSYASDGQQQLYFPEFDSADTNFGLARGVDGDASTHFLGKLRAGAFTLAALHGSRDKTVPTASFGTIFGDPRSGTIETQQFIDARYDRTLASGWHTGGRVYYDRYAYDGTYPYPDAEDAGAGSVLNLDFARGTRWGAEGTARKRLAQRHTLALGSEYRRNLRQDQYNYDVSPYHLYLDDRRSSTNWAVYAQDEIKLHDRLLVNLGLRHDEYDTFGGTTNPRAALIYTPTARTTMKLLYGQAFRAPNAYELFWQQDDVAKPNASLRPETNSTSEVVLEHSLGAAVRVGVTAFHYRVDDLISQQTDPWDELLVYNNVDRIDARGLELEAEGKWAAGITARTSYTYQDSRNHATRQPLTNSPAHVAQVLLRTPLGRPGLSAGFESRFLSERWTLAGNRLPSTVLANVTLLSRHRKSGIDIAATLLNLFDERVADPGSEEHRQDSIIQSGRTFRINVHYRLPVGK
jgi:iron complex outermembrane receptor protein